MATDDGTVAVVGEALIDLAPRNEALVPLPGGSPYNVAVGLGRLGTPVRYLGPRSTDAFGTLLTERLRDAGVDLDGSTRTGAPTTLAVVHLDEDRRATYGFYLAGTSAVALDPAALPDLGDATALHLSLGAVTFATDGAGPALAALLEREHGRRTLSLDPNVRPGVIDDLAGYARELEDRLAGCDLVKVSDEDLALLHPDADPRSVARDWVQRGPAAVVVTRGPDGAVGFTAEGDVVGVPGEDVEVVDTVGAGDAFTAGLLDELRRRDRLERDRLRDIGVGDLRAAMAAAVHVAAITCTRPGADPPTRRDLAP
jgi:fructokinase